MKFMKNLVCGLAVLISLNGNAQEILGDWYGLLNAMGSKLNIVFHIEASGDSLKGTVDSPDQNSFGVPMDKVTYANNELEITFGKGTVVYKATYSPSDSFLRGTFTQNNFTFLMSCAREKGKAPEMRRPQEPIRPFPYVVEEVEFSNKKADVTLAGTLTLPGEKGGYPAIILITGSGPQNRDSEILGHKPFLLLADRFTRAGYVVLRYDERGVGKSTGMYSSATSYDLAEDVEAGIDFLRKHDQVDKKRITLVGHSEGGMIAPMVAARNKHVAAVVMLAGPSVPGDEILADQTRRLMSANGIGSEKIDRTVEQMRELMQIIKTEDDKDKRNELLTEKVREQMEAMPTEDRDEIPNEDAFVITKVMAMSGKWYVNFVRHDPMPDLKKVECPLMAMYGSNDLQVHPNLNLIPLKEIMKDDWNLVQVAGLNHLFQPSETGLVSEYGQIETTFDMDALTQVVTWLNSLWKD